MALPVLPTYSISDAIEAAGVFLPYLQGGTKPSVAHAVHAAIVLETFGADKFFPDTVGVNDHNVAVNALKAIYDGDAGSLGAFDWKSLLITLMKIVLSFLESA